MEARLTAILSAGEWSLIVAVAIFVGATLVIAFAGTRITRLADQLADQTRLGEALVGGTLLGASTSLAGVVTSVAAAGEGYPELAVSNAVGGIAAQTVFLGIADIAYRRANLEHAVASIPNLLQGTILMALLALVLLAAAGPDFAAFGLHPISVVLVVGYVLGLRLVHRAQESPMWLPRATAETKVDQVEVTAEREPLIKRAAAFLVLAVLLGGGGLFLQKSAVAITLRTDLDEIVIGGLFTAIATSVPELVTTLAAIRRGALALAVGGIIGGNTFDVLFIALSDAAYRAGSIYQALSDRQVYFVALTMLLTCVLLLGLLQREKHGVANIGFEGVLLLALYGFGMAGLFFAL